ncbi:MAG: hypothetical protein ACFFB3_04590 [Candidatus Hodarchaeota archaeon]
MNETSIGRINSILEELKEIIPDTRAIFCINREGLVISEIGLDGLGRDAAGELLSLVVHMLGKAKGISFEMLGDPWIYAGFIGSQSYLLLGLVGDYAILGLLVDSPEDSQINLTMEYLDAFLKYCRELAGLLEFLFEDEA